MRGLSRESGNSMKITIYGKQMSVRDSLKDAVEKKLSNEGFVAKAPAAVIEGEKAKLEKYKEKLENIEAAIQKLQ